MPENATPPPPAHDARAARRRKATVVAGYEGPSEVLLDALGDPHPSVRAAALGALGRRRALGGPVITAALADPSPVVRRRACELAAARHRHDLALGPGLTSALHDPDPLVVDAACVALGERHDREATGALEQVATSHPDPRCREAAVAALGAIGDPATLPVVLRGLEDRPAIRRRSAVALAAFHGPEVEEALRKCLEDRDWQVRQVADELLG